MKENRSLIKRDRLVIILILFVHTIYLGATYFAGFTSIYFFFVIGWRFNLVPFNKEMEDMFFLFFSIASLIWGSLILYFENHFCITDKLISFLKL